MTAKICHEIALGRPLEIGLQSAYCGFMKNITSVWGLLILSLILALPAMAQRTKGTVTNSVSTKTNSTVTLTSPK